MKRTGMALLMVGVLLAGSLAAGTWASEGGSKNVLATYDCSEGRMELVDYQIDGNVIGLILDYTNTTSENVSPAWRIDVDLFQDGIRMDSGRSFDIKGVRSSFTEIRPGATLRIAEFFELENDHPIEVELSSAALFTDEEPMYVEVDLDTKKTKVTGGETSEKSKGSGSSSSSGGIMGAYSEAMDAYSQALDEYGKAYEKALDEYANTIDEAVDSYSKALDDMFSSWGF